MSILHYPTLSQHPFALPSPAGTCTRSTRACATPSASNGPTSPSQSPRSSSCRTSQPTPNPNAPERMRESACSREWLVSPNLPKRSTHVGGTARTWAARHAAARHARKRLRSAGRFALRRVRSARTLRSPRRTLSHGQVRAGDRRDVGDLPVRIVGVDPPGLDGVLALRVRCGPGQGGAAAHAAACCAARVARRTVDADACCTACVACCTVACYMLLAAFLRIQLRTVHTHTHTHTHTHRMFERQACTLTAS